MTAEDRFRAKVMQPAAGTGCHFWTGQVNQKGYGRFLFEGSRIAAHRFAYMAAFGPIPDGKVIDHLCRTRSCVNPEHLEVVTNRENVLRGVGRSAVAARRTRCRKGHPFDRVTPQGDRYCLACGAERKRSWRSRVLAGDKAEAPRPSYIEVHTSACHAGSDGDCSWAECPQLAEYKVSCPLLDVQTPAWSAGDKAEAPRPKPKYTEAQILKGYDDAGDEAEAPE